MTEGGKDTPEPPDEGNRNVENAVMLGFFAVLVANRCSGTNAIRNGSSGNRENRDA